jgi:DNA-binding XRE family transcriptional regulator
MGNTPSPAMTKLAAAVRRYRKRAALTQTQLAAMIPCSDKTISAIETGRERPSKEMVAAIERTLELPPEALIDLYDLLDVESLPRWMRDWVAKERRATSLRSFQLTTVPGLLQIEDYARALLPGNEAAVQARMDRQEIFTGDLPPTMRTVLDETVLYRDKGGAQVMHNQLKHLAELVTERLTIQIVPAGVSPRLSGSFVLATVDGREVASSTRLFVESSRAATRTSRAWKTSGKRSGRTLYHSKSHWTSSGK